MVEADRLILIIFQVFPSAILTIFSIIMPTQDKYKRRVNVLIMSVRTELAKMLLFVSDNYHERPSSSS